MGPRCEAPGLGVGGVWCPALDPLCQDGVGLVDVIEAEPETLWAPKSDGHGIRSFVGPALVHLPQPKLLHGVGAPLGGTCLAGAEHTRSFARDIADLRPAFVSQHLSFTHFRRAGDPEPLFAGFLLPPLQSAQGVALAAANIRAHRDALGGVPLAVETPVSYLPPAPGEWPDGAFVAAVAEEADCGILLDLHNVLCNARNGRQSVAAFCEALPLERVWEIHLAGGEAIAGFFTDAHSGLVEPELMEITAAVASRLPNLQAIVFEIMPERVEAAGLAAIADQLGQLKDLWAARRPAAAGAFAAEPARPTTSPEMTTEAWEALLGCGCAGLPPPAVAGTMAPWWSAAGAAVDLYRLFVGEGRASAVTVAAPRTTRRLLDAQGDAGVRRLFGDFWRQSPPHAVAVDEARAFFRFLSGACPALPGLADCIAADERNLASF